MRKVFHSARVVVPAFMPGSPLLRRFVIPRDRTESVRRLEDLGDCSPFYQTDDNQCGMTNGSIKVDGSILDDSGIPGAMAMQVLADPRFLRNLLG